MPTIEHDVIDAGEIHRPYNWSYADAAARAAATGFIAADVGKLARQLDDNSLWMLTATTPTWVAVSGSASAPFVDSTAIVKGSADPTKLLRIEVDGFTTATTRVLTPPNFDGTIGTLAGTETLTNKTLTGQNVSDFIDLAEIAAPSTPASAKVRLYAKADGLLYSKDDAGTETVVTGGGGGGATLADFKDSVRVATTAAGTLATSFENGDTVDGVVLATGDRILIKDQAAPADNGIYVVAASGAPTRATDFDASAEVTAGCIIPVAAGTVNGDKLFILTTNDPITLGSTSLAFSALSVSAAAVWSTLTDPSGNLSLAMAANLTLLTWGGNFGASSAFKLTGANTSATGPMLHVNTGVSNLMPPLLVEPRGGQSLKADHLGNVIIGKTGGMAASDTDGFPYLPFVSSSGEPTGTPTSVSGMAPIVLENDAIFGTYRLWVYLGSAWHCMTPINGGGTGSPTIAAGAGAGTGPTVSISSNGTNVAHEVNVTTGTTPSGSAVIVTITFNNTNGSFATAPYIILQPSNAAAAGLGTTSMIWVNSRSTTTYTIDAGTVGLTGSTTYKWMVHCYQ